MKVTRLFDLLPYARERYHKSDVLAHKKNGQWVTFSIDEYIEIAQNVSLGLLSLGIKKGDVIATISNNRPEWNFLDMGIMQTGAVHLSIYPTISVDEYRYIFREASPKIIIVSDKLLYEKLHELAHESGSFIKLYTINQVEQAANWTEITELGKQHASELQATLIEAMNNITGVDLAALTYTSGTTGNPKGVMLSHNNLLSNAIATAKAHWMDHNGRALSFLPLSHVYERMMSYHFQYKGISIYYAENMGTIVDNAREISPTIFNAVPRVIEMMYDKIVAKGRELPLIKRLIFFWAISVGKRFDYQKMKNPAYRVKVVLARKLIFSKWKDGLGGKIETIVSGGASLQIKLERIFWAAGIKLLNGYGLSETSPVVAAPDETIGKMKLGTVGPVLKDVQVLIADDGEILIKGPNVMMGYYKNPQQTAEVIDPDGWFHTGDIGVLIDNTYLKITDRKKEIFKLSSGKYVAPQPIENKLKESKLIAQAMVVGENQKYAAALIVPHFDNLKRWAASHGIKEQNISELIKNPKVIAEYQKVIQHVNHRIGKTEHIGKMGLIDKEWTPQSGELSPTLKLKRKLINETYKAEIERLF